MRSPFRRRRLLACAAAAVVPAVVLPAGPSPATFKGQNGRIAFSRDGRIFTIKPDSSGLRLLTPKGKGRAAPTWSPDGSTIAFPRFDQRRGIALFAMRADGSRVRRLTPYSKRLVGAAEWRPQGRQVLYHEHTPDADPWVGAIKLARADGSGQRNLTGDRDLNLAGSWSPDGQRIAFVRVVGGDPQGFGTPGAEIWVMDADGTGQTQLTHNDVLDDAPAWSPDEERIAFTRTVPGMDGDQGAELWTMDPDGSDERRLTAAKGFDESPEWSPDGRRIMFTRGKENRVEVFTIQPDGSDLKRIASLPLSSGYDAVWSPDSRRVLLTDGEVITIAAADGTKPRRLVRRGAFVDWQAR